MICRSFHLIKTWQHDKLNDAILEHKWYMSEKENHDVGFRDAQLDFIDNHMETLAKEWRHEYCTTICPHRNCCGFIGLFF